jgi:hypothetical protein
MNKSLESNNFRIYSAQKFIEGLQTQFSANNLYCFIGKTTPWNDEANPDMPNDSVAARKETFSDMLAVKRVSPSDVTLVIPNNSWTASVVYSQYNDQGLPASGIYYDQFEPTINAVPFFVITKDNNVYKCLSNSNGMPSSVMPTGTSTTPITLSDGYIWKFMYQVDSTSALKFLSSSWIPIHTLNYNDGSFQWSVQATSIPGEIFAIQVTNGGTGYSTVPIITVNGDGTGCTATAVLTGTTLTNIVVNTPGVNYTQATVTIGGPGTLGAATVILSPPGGHGSNPVYELGAMYAMVDVQFANSESDKITVSNDYRKFGLLLNPLTYNSPFYYFPLIGTLTTNLLISNITGTFNPDDIVIGNTSGATAYVVDFNSTLNGQSNVLRLTQIQGTFQVSETLNDSTSSAISEIVSIISPDLAPNTGLILTTEHISPVSRSLTQLEDIKVVIPF